MTRVLIVLGCLVLIYSCQLRTYPSKSCKHEIQRALDNYWKRGSDGILIDDKLQILNFSSQNIKECVIGLNRNQVKKIFGEPDNITTTTFQYYASTSCLNSNDCTYFFTFFDENTGNVIRMGLGVSSLDY